METSIPIERLRIVGGNLALDFVNTQAGPRGGAPDVESLHDYGDFVSWGLRVGLLTPAQANRLRRKARLDPTAADTVFTRVRAVREYLYEVFTAVAENTPPPSGCLSSLRADTAEALSHAELASAGHDFEWRWREGANLAAPLWAIIHAASEFLTSGSLRRIKGCGACRFLFVDESKNSSRRWCSMDDCGRTEKMRKYVARRAAARRSVPGNPR